METTRLSEQRLCATSPANFHFEALGIKVDFVSVLNKTQSPTKCLALAHCRGKIIIRRRELIKKFALFLLCYTLAKRVHEKK